MMPQAKVTDTIGIVALYEAIAPGEKGDEQKMLATLEQLTRDDTRRNGAY
jgi:hypothetical protein